MRVRLKKARFNQRPSGRIQAALSKIICVPPRSAFPIPLQERSLLKPTKLMQQCGRVALFAATLTIGAGAQAPQAETPASGGSATGSGQPGQQHNHPAPTNLQVLPKTLTGEQVHEIMEKWEGYLGAKCSTCHTADPKRVGPNGRPQLNFADDSKKEKATARQMFKMTEMINVDYIGKIDSSGEPVTCGTCHRGHLGPEPYKIPPEDHDHDHGGPPPAQGGPAPAK
jgi:hypothetical protein